MLYQIKTFITTQDVEATIIFSDVLSYNNKERMKCSWGKGRGQLRMKREMLYGMKTFVTTQDVGADNVLQYS